MLPFLPAAGISTSARGELLEIAGGDPANVFHVDDFDVLEGEPDHNRELGKSCFKAGVHGRY